MADDMQELKRRVDALFTSATGRVGPTHADLAAFVARLHSTANALLRERFPQEAASSVGGEPVPAPSKRQRLESVVCSGSWARKYESVAELESVRGQDAVYEDVTILVDEAGTLTLELRQFVEHFWCSGCRLWDSAVALARWLHANPERVRGKSVLEVGCGVAPVPGLVAALSAVSVRLTDTEANLLATTRHDVARASHLLPTDALPLVAELNWGDEPASLAEQHGQHDVLLGSDLIYSSGASAPLAAAASALVRPGGQLIISYPSGES